MAHGRATVASIVRHTAKESISEAQTAHPATSYPETVLSPPPEDGDSKADSVQVDQFRRAVGGHSELQVDVDPVAQLNRIRSLEAENEYLLSLVNTLREDKWAESERADVAEMTLRHFQASTATTPEELSQQLDVLRETYEVCRKRMERYQSRYDKLAERRNDSSFANKAAAALVIHERQEMWALYEKCKSDCDHYCKRASSAVFDLEAAENHVEALLSQLEHFKRENSSLMELVEWTNRGAVQDMNPSAVEALEKLEQMRVAGAKKQEDDKTELVREVMKKQKELDELDEKIKNRKKEALCALDLENNMKIDDEHNDSQNTSPRRSDSKGSQSHGEVEAEDEDKKLQCGGCDELNEKIKTLQAENLRVRLRSHDALTKCSQVEEEMEARVNSIEDLKSQNKQLVGAYMKLLDTVRFLVQQQNHSKSGKLSPIVMPSGVARALETLNTKKNQEFESHLADAIGDAHMEVKDSGTLSGREQGNEKGRNREVFTYESLVSDRELTNPFGRRGSTPLTGSRAVVNPTRSNGVSRGGIAKGNLPPMQNRSFRAPATPFGSGQGRRASSFL